MYYNYVNQKNHVVLVAVEERSYTRTEKVMEIKVTISVNEWRLYLAEGRTPCITSRGF